MDNYIEGVKPSDLKFIYCNKASSLKEEYDELKKKHTEISSENELKSKNNLDFVKNFLYDTVDNLKEGYAELKEEHSKIFGKKKLGAETDLDFLDKYFYIKNKEDKITLCDAVEDTFQKLNAIEDRQLFHKSFLSNVVLRKYIIDKFNITDSFDYDVSIKDLESDLGIPYNISNIVYTLFLDNKYEFLVLDKYGIPDSTFIFMNKGKDSNEFINMLVESPLPLGAIQAVKVENIVCVEKVNKYKLQLELFGSLINYIQTNRNSIESDLCKSASRSDLPFQVSIHSFIDYVLSSYKSFTVDICTNKISFVCGMSAELLECSMRDIYNKDLNQFNV